MLPGVVFLILLSGCYLVHLRYGESLNMLLELLVDIIKKTKGIVDHWPHLQNVVTCAYICNSPIFLQKITKGRGTRKLSSVVVVGVHTSPQLSTFDLVSDGPQRRLQSRCRIRSERGKCRLSMSFEAIIRENFAQADRNMARGCTLYDSLGSAVCISELVRVSFGSSFVPKRRLTKKRKPWLGFSKHLGLEILHGPIQNMVVLGCGQWLASFNLCFGCGG